MNEVRCQITLNEVLVAVIIVFVQTGHEELHMQSCPRLLIS